MKLYNSVTKQVDDFTPIAPPTVSLYVCGVTVYDYCHLGHARAYVAFDLLKRVLTHHGYTVIHVQNVTDIDDKIIARANDQGEDINALTHRFMAACREDLDALNILPPNYMPKATTHVPDMIQLIQQLIQMAAPMWLVKVSTFELHPTTIMAHFLIKHLMIFKLAIELMLMIKKNPP